MSVRLDLSDIQKMAATLRSKFPAGMRRAMKRTAISARTEMARLIAEDTGIGMKYARDEIKTTSDETSATLDIKGFRIPLIQFKARGPEPSRGRGRGVSYKLTGGRGRAPNAFITTMASGHRGVFQRAAKTRTPIHELKGPSLVRVFDRYAPQVAKRAGAVLIKNVQGEINFALRGNA